MWHRPRKAMTVRVAMDRIQSCPPEHFDENGRHKVNGCFQVYEEFDCAPASEEQISSMIPMLGIEDTVYPRKDYLHCLITIPTHCGYWLDHEKLVIAKSQDKICPSCGYLLDTLDDILLICSNCDKLYERR